MDILATSYFLIFWIIAATLLLTGIAIARHIKHYNNSWTRLSVTFGQTQGTPLARSDSKSASRFFALLTELQIPCTIEFWVAGVGETIHVAVSVPISKRKKIIGLLEYVWPKIQIGSANDHDFWLESATGTGAELAGGSFDLRFPYVLPLDSNPEHSVVTELFRALSNLKTLGEGALLQWVIRPANRRLLQDSAEHLRQLAAGSYRPSRHIPEHFLVTPETIKQLETKIRQPLLAVNARLLCYDARGEARSLLERLASPLVRPAAHPTLHNHLRFTPTTRTAPLLELAATGAFDPVHEMILNADEVAAYCYLPSGNPSPKLARHTQPFRL